MIINDKNNYVDMMAKFVEALGYTDVKQSGDENIVNIMAKKMAESMLLHAVMI